MTTTHNAVIHFPVPLCDGHVAINPYTDEKQTAQQWLAYKKEKQVRDWLAENGYNEPLIVYDNCDANSTTGEIVVVLTDRDTAIMLKLSLG